MRYLRMLTNSMLAGVLAAMYLTVLVLQLNPHVPVVSPTAWRWFLVLLAMYGPYLTAALLLLILAREALASRPLQPGWLSLRILAWLSAASAIAASAITWANLQGMRSALNEAAADRMRQGATALSICAGLLLTVAVLRYSFGRRGNRPAAVVLIVSVSASLAVPLWIRGPGELPLPAARRPNQAPAVSQPPRVRLLVIDGGSRDFILQRVASGQLPNFGALVDRGAVIDLATLRPTQAESVWTAAATGKYPPQNGIRSDHVYRVAGDMGEPVNVLPDYCFSQALLYQGFVRAEALTASSLRARTMWEILDDYQVTSGVVNWPLTRGARLTRGYLVSDYFDDAMRSPARGIDASSGDPTTSIDVARQAFDYWLAAPADQLLPAPAPPDTALASLQRIRWDRAFSDASGALAELFAPRMSALRLEAVDVLGHAHLRDAQPDLFGEIARRDPRRSVLDSYYAVLDQEVGRQMAATGSGDLLLVVSGFGMERTSLLKRLLARTLGEADPTGSHEAAPDGFLMAFGTHVAPGEFRRGAIVDLAPTVLYYMGVPIGRDMDGFARTDLFRAPYTREHAVTYTLTHER
jgi:hypothetical protein